jgi:hydroxymethylglutaryl-CoA lyase
MTEDWMPHPIVAAIDGLPARVRVYEVGPRDGLQAEADPVPTDVKVELCRRLYAAGVRDLEVSSFVPPSWIPQLADAAEVFAQLEVPDGARAVALVPNLRGLDGARAAGLTDVAVVVSATESFARANLNADRRSALDRGVDTAAAARAGGASVRGYVSMAFGDPWEGAVDSAIVAESAASLLGAGCTTIALGDTIGVATPGQITAVVTAVREAGVPADAIALHLHDTYGQALANVREALQLGIEEFDASVGGLGRCPYARGATGNLATEDLVWMLQGLGIDTGLDLLALAGTTAWLAEVRGVPAPSRVARALAAAGALGAAAEPASASSVSSQESRS